VHNNFVRTKASKLARFSAMHMWRVASIDEGKCIENPLPSYESTVAPYSRKWELALKIVAQNADEAIKLIGELQAADYEGARMDVTVLLPDESSELTALPYGQGKLSIVVGTPSRPADIWVPSTGASGHQLVVVISSVATVPRTWHRTILSLLSRYMGDDFRNFDPRAFGIGLAAHGTLRARAYNVYRVQDLPTIAVLFPLHWSRFLRSNSVFDPDLRQTVARWMALNGYYTIVAATSVDSIASLPSVAKLPTYDMSGREIRNTEALAARAWYYEADVVQADAVIEQTAIPAAGKQQHAGESKHGEDDGQKKNGRRSKDA